VTNLWPEFPAHDVYRGVANVTECKNPKKSVVAATFEKAKTYVFAEPLVWDREVGGSNPLAPTNNLNLSKAYSTHVPSESVGALCIS
jgi:hypothetical protein